MYDAIVVGARCAGAPTAMLLARKGYKVLLVDKARFPSDTISTAFILPAGVDHLRDWGTLDKVRATNAPAILKGNFFIEGVHLDIGDSGGFEAYCPKRILLDKILVDEALHAGAEVREGFAVDELIWDDEAVIGVRGRLNGHVVEENARIIIGADGKRSKVAQAVRAPQYLEKPAYTFGYYSFWSGVGLTESHVYLQGDRGVLAFPSNDGLACIAVGGPHAQFGSFRSNVEGNYLQSIARFPELAERMQNARREERFKGTADLPNFFRKPFGVGWALVGDAGYHKDPITALGITDAFRDAQLLASAVDDGLSGRRVLTNRLEDYEVARNEAATPLYELTTQLVGGIAEGTLEMAELFTAFNKAFSAIRGRQHATAELP